MIIEVDEYKKKIVNYDPKRSEDFHKESANMADEFFTNELKSKKYRNVILMAGGTASGKTEYATEYIINKKTLVYDGTLKDFKGYAIKLQRIKRHAKITKNIKIILIIPINIKKSFSAFLGRERKMNNKIFFETQIKSKLTIAKILREENTKVEIFFSDHEEGKTKLKYIRFNMKSGRKNAADFMEKLAGLYKEIAVNIGFDMN